MAPEIAREDYLFLRTLLRKQIGYDLVEGKEYLVKNRLTPVAASFGLTNIADLVRRLRLTGDLVIRNAVCEAMTVNETNFYRDPSMFEVLRKELIPTLKTARATTQRLRLWCAACSTGQEPYSIAMMLVDNFPELKDWKADLLATDIAERTLDIARRGVYNQFEVQRGLSIQALLKHFQQLGNQWEISPTIRNFVQFRKFNLLNSFAGLGGPFDIIFIRNVLIYFDDPTKSSILARLRQVIMPDGYLILGGAETVLRLSNHFASVKGAFNYYKPVG